MPIIRRRFVVIAVVLGLSGCRSCEQMAAERDRKMNERDAVCYAMPVSEAAQEVRAILAEQRFPLPPETADDPGLIATGWKDTTVGASRLTFAGRPERARREVFIAGATCVRFAVRAISQRTPKEGPDYAEVSYYNTYEEDELTMAIHDRLRVRARVWQPPPEPQRPN
jgi:hypothetical protein